MYTTTTQKGFSLIELLIVIVVIGMVYAIGLTGFSFSAPKAKALTPLNLKQTLIKLRPPQETMTLMCIDNCNKCFLSNGISTVFSPYPNKIDLKNIEAYTLDERSSLRKIEYQRYQDKKICLIMDFYSNGSSTQIILKDDKYAYFLPAFFGEAKRFDSVDDAQDYWVEKSKSLSNSGEFY